MKKTALLGLILFGTFFLVTYLSLDSMSKKSRPSDAWYSQSLSHHAKARHVPAESQRSSSCFQTYQDLLADGVLSVVVVFGYKDARPARFVGDRYERMAFGQYLVERCRNQFFACGFQRNQRWPDLYHKTMLGLSGERISVELELVHSSVGPDDDVNRSDGFQSWQSHYAREEFHRGLKQADVVFYYGHSRDGGGPDFDPPKLRWDGHAHYNWYERQKPGLKAMEKILAQVSQRPRLLGLFSCVSSDLFRARLLKAQPSLGLISSPQLLYYTDAMRSMLSALSSVIGMRCKEGFADALQASATRYSSEMVGFFRNPKKP